MTGPDAVEGGDRILCGRYRLLSRIGEGGMGTVWLAHDELLDRPVAVKEVTTPLGSDAANNSTRERMIREARAAARLDHPGAVRVYDIADEDDEGTGGVPWIVMEVLNGRTLQEVVREDGPLSPHRVAGVGLALIDAIAAAHRAGILHRDIKPANVQICEDGRVVLTDFGIASMTGDASITRTGDILGSPAYMSPERAKGRSVDSASDLFSLGATLYAAVEGSPPFERDTPVATLTAVVTDPPAPYRRAGALQPVLDGLLAKDPEQRLDADTARALLTAVSRGEDLPSLPPTSPPRTHEQTQTLAAVRDRVDDALPLAEPVPPHRRVRTLTIALLVIVLGVTAGIAAWQLTDRQETTGEVGGTSKADDGPFSPGQGSVPADWTTRQGPSGDWSIATPANWTEQNPGSVRRWRRPSPYGYIAVVQSSGSSAETALTAFESPFARSHDGYQQESTEAVKFRGTDAAVVTFIYRDDGTELKASQLAYKPEAGSSRVYILWWQTLPDGWDDSQDLRSKVLASFRPGG